MKKTRLGIGFADTLKHATATKRRKLDYDKQFTGFTDPEALLKEPVTARTASFRVAIIKVAVLCFAALLVSRLFHLQVVQGDSLRARSDANRTIVKTIHAPRGIMYDRNGIALVENTPAFVKVSTNSAELVSREEALAMEATGSANQLEIQAVRHYPFGANLAHVLGYTSEVTKEELDNPKYSVVYRLGDRIGRSGLEQFYEPVLRGEDGAELIEVDALHNTQKKVGTRESVQGNNVALAIDSKLQKTAEEALSRELQKLNLPSGVVIVQQAKTGEIMALVSLPNYDNNMFSGKVDAKTYSQLLENPNRPFFDRAVGGVYPPGSIYKIVTSTAGLLSGKVNSATKIEDTGVIYLGPYRFPNWYWLSSGRTDGILDLPRALARSNDIFYYRVGEWVGQEYLAQIARRLGLGKKTGIDLPGETEGLVPDDAWKQNVVGEPWYPGDTYHMAIGQGFNLTTPIQLSVLTAFVANNGVAYKPHLVTKILDQSGKATKILGPEVLYKDILPKRDLVLIQDGMRQACTPGGTGWPLFNFGISQFEQTPEATQAAEIKKPIQVACKTGTAEYGDPGKRTHAWFTAYAPYENPEIIVTVLIESGGEGSNVSAPVAKDILEWYFKNK